MIYVLEKGKKECTPLENGVNLLTSSVSESLESMVNRVRVYNKEDKLIKEFKEDKDIKLYGFMTEILRISKDDEDYTESKKATERRRKENKCLQFRGQSIYHRKEGCGKRAIYRSFRCFFH